MLFQNVARLAVESLMALALPFFQHCMFYCLSVNICCFSGLYNSGLTRDAICLCHLV